MNKKKNNPNWCFITTYIIYPLAIVMIMCFGMKEQMTIHVASDEFGYWTAAANFMKYDWSNCASLNEYYSFGYGILLAPLLLIENAVLSYKIALYINVLLILLSYLAINKLLLYLTGKEMSLEICTTALLTSVYPGLIFYSKETLAECMLWLCYCLSSLVLIKFIKDGNRWCLIFMSALSVYMLWCHMRAIGIVVACFFTIVISAFSGKRIVKNRAYVHAMVVLLLGVIVFFILKDDLVTRQYIYKSGNANEVSGQIGKIKHLFTMQGSLNLIANLIGRMWYLGNTTFLLFYFGLYSCIEKMIFYLRNKDRRSIYYFYVIVSFLFAIGISSVYMLGLSEGRKDTLFYGRYSEYVIAPILAQGVMILIYKKKALFHSSAIVILHILFALLVRYFLNEYNMTGQLDVSIPGFYYWFNRETFSNDAVISSSLVTVLLFFLFTCITFFGIGKQRYIALMMVVVLYARNGYLSYSVSDTHKHDEDYLQAYFALKEYPKNMSEVELCYCFSENDKDEEYYFLGIDRLQFLLKNKKILFMCTDYDAINREMIVITRPGSEGDAYISQRGNIFFGNSEFRLYCTQ